MTGCVLLDSDMAARQNGKRLPCERLMAENAKLRELVRCLVAAIHPLDRAEVIANAAEFLAELGVDDTRTAEAWDERAEPRTCATCYYYQTIHERGRRTERKACFGEHLHAAVGGLDWEDEAECWAEMEPDDFCSEWTPRDVRSR